MKTKLSVWLLAILLIAVTAVSASQPDTVDIPAVESSADLITGSLDSSSIDSPSVDTTLYIPVLKRSTATSVTNPVNFEKHLSQKPTVALFKSLLVPGLGQIGNKRYLKGAIVIGLDSWFVSRAIHHGQQASEARRKWQAASLSENKLGLYTDFNDKRSTRNKFIWFAGIVTFLSIFDAYVDAHLSGAPEDNRNNAFEVTIAPEPDGGAILAVRLSF